MLEHAGAFERTEAVNPEAERGPNSHTAGSRTRQRHEGFGPSHQGVEFLLADRKMCGNSFGRILWRWDIEIESGQITFRNLTVDDKPCRLMRRHAVERDDARFERGVRFPLTKTRPHHSARVESMRSETAERNTDTCDRVERLSASVQGDHAMQTAEGSGGRQVLRDPISGRGISCAGCGLLESLEQIGETARTGAQLERGRDFHRI